MVCDRQFFAGCRNTRVTGSEVKEWDRECVDASPWFAQDGELRLTRWYDAIQPFKVCVRGARGYAGRTVENLSASMVADVMRNLRSRRRMRTCLTRPNRTSVGERRPVE